MSASSSAFASATTLRRLSLFGSQLKGTARPDSDIDLLVEFEPGHSPGYLALATMEAAQGLPMHLAHIQFYGYGQEGPRAFSSAAARLMDGFRRHPNITMDVGQVLFGQTVTISGDVIAQYSRRDDASPAKWVAWDAECEGGGGVVPYRYRESSFVNSLQWAIGLEIFLLADDPWRVFFTTDHPNGAHFTRYPQLFRLLMDYDYRLECLEKIHPEVAELSLLRHLKKEFTLYEIAIMTRTAAARLLGLADRGRLAPAPWPTSRYTGISRTGMSCFRAPSWSSRTARWS